MRCQKIREYISQEMDELLPPAVTGDLTSHLDSCSDCREYREDLLLGRRAILATTPELSDNFEWKLQLRLNQTLQQTAGQSAFPWEEEHPDKWRWARNFGAAAAVGMAAVLALAMFLGPVGGPGEGGTAEFSDNSPGMAQTTDSGAGGSDRLPLFSGQSSNRGLYSSEIQTPVSAGGLNQSKGTIFDRKWSGHNLNDLKTIQGLMIQNNLLSRRLSVQQKEIRVIRAQLDTIDANALNLEQE